LILLSGNTVITGHLSNRFWMSFHFAFPAMTLNFLDSDTISKNY